MEKQFVQVKGTEFIKGDQPILFRGIGIGSWLNMEHFMLGIPTPDNQIRRTFQEVFGSNTSDLFFDSFIRDFIGEKDFEYLAEQGVNVIRVPFNYRLFLDDQQPDTLKKGGFEYLDRLLDLCDQYHIYLLWDLHAVPGGQNPDWHSDNNTGIPQFWHYKVFRDQIVKLWGVMAAHCKDREYLLGYDLLNEPYLIDAPDVLMDFYKEVTAEIRKVDTNHVIFLEGDHFAMKFDILHDIEDANTALSFHYYPTVWEPDLFKKDFDRAKRKEKFAEVLSDILPVRERFQRPVFCGEAGYDIDKDDIEHGISLLSDTLQLFEEHQISWTFWSYKDAQFMGICYPVDDSPWMQFVKQIHKSWTHYEEMDMAKEAMNRIADQLPFQDATEELRYLMQFRERGILYRFQTECVLKPLLSSYTKEQILSLPKSFRFENCRSYPEYEKLLQKICKRGVEKIST